MDLPKSQLTADCGPESVCAVLNYWNRPVTVEDISAIVRDRGKQGILSSDLPLLARSKGLQATFLEGAVTHLRRAIRRGVPPILMVGTDDGGGHFFVVIAYSDVDRAIICEDYGGLKRMIEYGDLETKWDAGGRLLLLLELTTVEKDVQTATELESREKYVEAGKLFRRALETEPEHHAARVGLGNCLLHQGKLEEALAEYRHAEKIDPDDPRLVNNIAHILLELKRDTAGAERLAEKAVDLFREAHARARSALERETQLAVRKARARDLRHAGLDLAYALGTLGQAREAVGKDAMAVSAWKASYDHLPLDKGNLRARRLLLIAGCCRRMEMPNEARATLKKALREARDPELKKEIEAALSP